MDQVLRGVPAAYTYIDDVLIASPSPEQHLADLRIVFERLTTHSIVVNPNKCLFSAPELDFLGLDNVVADALSRIETNALLSGQPPPVDFATMAKTQATDPQIRALQSSPTSTLVVKAVPLANSADPLYCDTSIGHQRSLVPLPWRCTVFNSPHGLSHPGIRATQKLITSRFVWPGINT